jgi:hypothetical protein
MSCVVADDGKVFVVVVVAAAAVNYEARLVRQDEKEE